MKILYDLTKVSQADVSSPNYEKLRTRLSLISKWSLASDMAEGLPDGEVAIVVSTETTFHSLGGSIEIVRFLWVMTPDDIASEMAYWVQSNVSGVPDGQDLERAFEWAVEELTDEEPINLDRCEE